MNYGYVYQDPARKKDDYLSRVRVVLQRRPNTAMVSMTTANTLQAFIEHLELSSSVTRPIDDMVVAGHSNRWGWEMDLFGASTNADFEKLQETITDPDKSIAVPDAVIGFDPTDPNPPDHFFHIKGCNLGQVPKYLERLHAALGSRLKITAPKHFHGVSDLGTNHYFEWMAYEFRVFQKTKLTTRAQLAAVFDAAGLTLVDGQPVPTADWTKWLKRFRRVNTTQKPKIRSKLGIPIGKYRSVNTQTILYASNPTSPLVWRDFVFAGTGPIPTDEPTRLAHLKTDLLTLPTYQAPFPMYERLGYATIDDMLAGLKWKIYPDPSDERTLKYFGGRYQYELMVPIMDTSTNHDPTKGTLIFNHWPKTGSSVGQAILETDTDFFLAVP